MYLYKQPGDADVNVRVHYRMGLKLRLRDCRKLQDKVTQSLRTRLQLLQSFSIEILLGFLGFAWKEMNEYLSPSLFLTRVLIISSLVITNKQYYICLIYIPFSIFSKSLSLMQIQQRRASQTGEDGTTSSEGLREGFSIFIKTQGSLSYTVTSKQVTFFSILI